MKVQCRTNWDEGKRQEWPDEMVCRPEVGDYVEAKSGYRLRVVSLSHMMKKVSGYQEAERFEPVLIVELNK